jgi:uncharacterized protein
VIYLLDVNVLIALIDPLHFAHERAHHWFSAKGAIGWATSPITENGALRIVGNPSYSNSAGAPHAVVPSLASVRMHPGHRFWGDDVSLLDSELIDTDRLMTSGQVTDTYLLALAVVHGGQLATFDRRLVPDAVRGGAAALCLIAGH